MRRLWILITAIGVALGFNATVPGVYANITYPTSEKHIYLNGSEVEDVFGITALDPRTHAETTYMPIWYVIQSLNSLGIVSAWNGQQWSMTLPSYITVPSPISNITPHTGDKLIYINKTLVQSVPSITYTDPISGVPTTYMPIWYVMQALKTINISPKWDGTTWEMDTTPSNADTQNDLVSINGPSTVNVTTGDYVDVQWSGAGGNGNYLWIDPPSQSIPISLNWYKGRIWGNVSSTGQYKITIGMTDAQLITLYRTVTMNVFNIRDITTLSIPAGRLNLHYAPFQLQANKPVPGITWSIVTGSLPPGLHLTSSGQIYGVPTQTGKFTVKICATYPEPETHGSVNVTRVFTIYVTS